MCNTDLIVFGARLLACIGYGFALLCISVSILAALSLTFRKQSAADRKIDRDGFGAGLVLSFGTALFTTICLKLLG